MITDRIILASDHAGYELKEKVKKHLLDKGLQVKDIGTVSADSVDYPDFGHQLASEIENGNFEYGISLCGSANGINMTTNKHQGIRSAICWDKEIARLARAHNNANICALPARFIDEDLAYKMLDIFLNTDFDGGRHKERINKIPCK